MSPTRPRHAGPARAAKQVRYAWHRRTAGERLRRRIASSGPPYRLELGAGETDRPGWLSTDVRWNARYYLDATAAWPFPAASVSHVYADNMIEHVPLDGARALLREAAAAMQSGARIRLVTPDVERCAEVYLERGERARAQLDAHRGAGTRVEHVVDVLRGVFVEYEHALGYAWDYDSLSTELAAAGFTSIERCELRKSVDPVLRDLEARVLPIDHVTMLAIEARRP